MSTKAAGGRNGCNFDLAPTFFTLKLPKGISQQAGLNLEVEQPHMKPVLIDPPPKSTSELAVGACVRSHHDCLTGSTPCTFRAQLAEGGLVARSKVQVRTRRSGGVRALPSQAG